MPEKVHKRVSFSRKRFIGDVIKNNLLPPASAPVFSVKEGIRNGYRNPGEPAAENKKYCNLCQGLKTRDTFLHFFADRNMHGFKLCIGKGFTKPNCCARRKTNESANLASIAMSTCISCAFASPKLFWPETFHQGE